MSKELSEFTQADIRELITYDPETGRAFWKERDAKWFTDGYRTAQGNANNWNSKNSGQEILCATHGYKIFRIFRQSAGLHRLIWLYMTGEWPEEVDHINGIRSDNRWCNLRNVTHQENGRNVKIPSHNSSGYLGVFFEKSRNKWRAGIKINQKSVFLGRFYTLEEAIAARKVAEIKYGFHENHGRKE